MILLWAALASAHELWVVRQGETVASIAAALGDPALAASLRAANGLAADAEPAPGTVLRVEGATVQQQALVLLVSGSGTVREVGRPPAPLLPGRRVPEGALVCTDPGSSATIRLAVSTDSHAHDDITLLAATCLTVDGASARGADRSSLVSVRSGSVAVRAAGDQDGTVAVRTDAGVATGDGGGFRVHVEGAAVRAEAVAAPVAVIGAGTEVALAAGEGSRVRAGEAPSAPVALLAGGPLVAPADAAPLRVPDFTWTPTPRGHGYRVEIAAEPDFVDLVAVQDVPGPAWRPDTLLARYRGGVLYWRVSAYDGLGFLGVPSETRSLAFPAGLGP